MRYVKLVIILAINSICTFETKIELNSWMFFALSFEKCYRVIKTNIKNSNKVYFQCALFISVNEFILHEFVCSVLSIHFTKRFNVYSFSYDLNSKDSKRQLNSIEKISATLWVWNWNTKKCFDCKRNMMNELK